MKPFFERQSEWDDAIGRVYAQLERVKLAEDRTPDPLVLRRESRIRSVWSSVVIEGNRLTAGQAEGVVNGQPVYGPARDIAEVQGAWAAYEAMGSYDPVSLDSFLAAHRLLTSGLLADAGVFRTVDVEVVNADGEVLHEGADPELVPRGMEQLFAWAGQTDTHPLLVSSATHFMIEFIHPFRDGNGRMGRLWQTLMLSRWNEVFAWMPIETLIHDHQEGYYGALQASHNGHIEASPFISFMLGIIEASLKRYAERVRNEGRNDGVNEGRTVRLDATDRVILAALTTDGTLTASSLAVQVKKSRATVERHLAKLRTAGLIRRVGATKNGLWLVKQAGGTRS
ncbi:MAG: Fic family protein [Propionibacteriaceae bacterium]|jgi:Fic family protein|nr:Fic family protein [Propionibacteriaceae bacterium]